MTRKLSELHINTVIEAINNDTIEVVYISPAKKPKGSYNITYKVTEPGSVSSQHASKGVLKVQLINALKEIKTALQDGKINSTQLEYRRAENKFLYQLIQQ